MCVVVGKCYVSVCACGRGRGGVRVGVRVCVCVCVGMCVCTCDTYNYRGAKNHFGYFTHSFAQDGLWKEMSCWLCSFGGCTGVGSEGLPMAVVATRI